MRVIKSRVTLGVLIGWLLTGTVTIYGFAVKDQALRNEVATNTSQNNDQESRLRTVEQQTRQYDVLIAEIQAARRDIERLRDAVGPGYGPTLMLQNLLKNHDKTQ